ncbi:putative receptor-like protein kinase At3g47110 [Rutidosis leptorrhynchoides]|uniref:putative receptor-like protein kinase At3g47110 n=1 Tax=Rutidosis leptorrhynchoides TaxID=125765 RepID=UPI003A9A4064
MKSREPICSSFSSLTAFLFSCLLIYLMMTTTNSTISSPSYDYGNETDHVALLSFKSLITHDPYGVLTSWNTSLHFCEWSGVTCGKRHKRVTALRLSSQGLEGSLSPHVGNLSFLRELWLVNNSFHKTIPHELGRLFKLQIINLDENKFNGTIPTNLSGCSNLKTLRLYGNKLVGSIPKEISLLTKLTTLALSDNRLTGGIPSFLGNITSLEMISLIQNPFGGSIPDNFGHLKSLKELYVGGCNLTGTIPPSIYNLSLLIGLSLAENQLTGSLPLAFGGMLPHLTRLQLRNNQLTGLLPSSISNCSQLIFFDMNDNSFSGKLTIDFSKLTDIFSIALGNNLFGGAETNEMKFIDSLNNCSKLEKLFMYNCNFEGELPRSVGNLSDQLSELNLGMNRLYGNLPSSIGNLVGLTRLVLVSNRLSGKIPSTIGNLQKLQLAMLYENQFSGEIPDAIGNLSRINRLVLNFNKLEGIIPSSLGNCHRLELLDLHNNRLSGNIPKQLLQLSSLTLELDLSQNNLFGSLPSEVGDLNMLTYLDLAHNNLSGNIPSSLGGCTSLSYLYINDNLFQGMLPPSLSSMRGLVELDLSHNNLSGQIPQFLEGFSLHALNLSSNNFEGEVPMKGVFANASEFYITGNGKLCGGLVELGLPKCKDKESKKYKWRFPVFVIVLLIASTLLVVSCVVCVLFKKKRKFKKKRNGQSSQSLTNERFLKVSYDQLLKATDDFSEANLIGKGGSSFVYKGILKHDDSFVAVKVLHLQIRGAHKNFVRECEVWQTIRHRNLLKIITSCSSVDFQGNDFKALVYEFMPNGSLHDWLHSSAHAPGLNLIQKINILIDVAFALDYLHNCCITTIVHCDLKPSNILLDDDMVAHVGDFGLARFLGTSSDLNISYGLKGTIGYAPPEYGFGSVMTTSGDVYSFGILLLEVMTGKNPTHNMFNEGLSLHKFVSTALVDHTLADVIDNDAITMQRTEAHAKKVDECLALTLKIGLSCSADSPTQRLKIENVVRELHLIKDALQNIQEIKDQQDKHVRSNKEDD